MLTHFTRFHLRPLAACGLLALSVAGCNQQSTPSAPGQVTTEDVRRDAAKALDTTAEYSQQAKEDFLRKLEVRLKELDIELEKLREKGVDLKDEARVKWEQQRNEVEVKRQAAIVKLEETRESSAAAWKDVRQGTQAAWDDLEKALQNARQEF